MNENILCALLLTVFAGLSTGIGSAIAFFAKRTNKKFLCFSLGFSAGVMIYISFMEMLHDARINLTEILQNERSGDIWAVLMFFGGMALAAAIDKLIPDVHNPHELHNVEEMQGADNQQHHHSKTSLGRTGVVVALAIAIHNFPEGIATFMSGCQDLSLGVAIAFAVAIHNIPEGVAVSVPIYYATGSKRKALWLSMLSGLAEPLGAVIAYLILLPFITPMLLNCVMAVVAGIMIYIAFDELLPAAHQYGENHISIYGLVSGMVIMAVSLILMM